MALSALRLTAVATAAALLASCAPSPPPVPRHIIVVVDQLAFGAIPPGLRVGDTIVWDNRDLFEHSATASDGSFDSDLPVGTKVETILRTAGTIRVTCKFHPGMTASFNVAAS